MNKALFSSNRLDWCTPQDLYDSLNERYRFTLDPAATDKSAKCGKYYTPETDGLNACWANERVFCNPPYGREIAKWVKKAYCEWLEHNITIVMLLPARTDTAYFHDYILGKAQIKFIRGRLHFENENGKQLNGAPFPSMLVIFERKEAT